MLYRYIAARLLYAVPALFLVSVVAFAIVQLPPGDFFDTYMAAMEAGDANLSQLGMAQFEQLRERYALDQPLIVQYWRWIGNIVLHGDFGHSFEWNRPVSTVILDRLGITLVVSIAALVLVYAVALPIGIYSAVRKYTLGDYVFSFLGFLGLSLPTFLVALVLMYVTTVVFGQSVGGLFSPEYVDAPWSFARFIDLLAHLWIPTVIIAFSSTAALIRVMRANLLDELNKPYVQTARVKGQSEFRLLMRYPVRVALNPFVSRLGWELPSLISSGEMTAIVLNLPTTGPMLLLALKSQDMFLASGTLLILSGLTVVGTLVSDILLAFLDPRIREAR